MKKLLSLIKACMTENMSIFKVKTKNQSETSKKILPIVLFGLVFFSMWSYANILMESLVELHVEYILLTLFVGVTSLLTLVEGIYKSGNLLFNCKDDDLLLSLPIKKSTVLFVRMFKFYVFELLYNSLFLVPAIVVYATKVSVGISFYIVSIIAIVLLPIIPIVISCIIGFITTGISSKFKFKNIVQIVITMGIILVVFFASYNINGLIDSLAQNADSINEVITKIYYPAGAYIKLVTEFNIQDLLIFIGIHILISVVTIFILSKVYFRINSRTKAVSSRKNSNKEYKIRTNKPLNSLIKKELGRFISSPVFVTNAAFSLVLFIIACVLICVKLDSVPEILASRGMEVTVEQIQNYIPIVLFGLISFASFTSSITSSMISLEGRSFNILKSLPVKPSKIILSKIYASVAIMVPFILIGDIIFFVRFNFNIFEIIGIIIVSFILPLISETIGILVNLKYPKMDAENDSEVVKQSMSSMIAVFIGMGLTGVAIILIVMCAMFGLANYLTILIGTVVFIIIYLLLLLYLNKSSVKDFNKINV
ncbi:MAG: hypothetical protein J6M60_01675 [Clostridia bacterium]|nr:hypothetical protein [Clostridia bacterium]